MARARAFSFPVAQRAAAHGEAGNAQRTRLSRSERSKGAIVCALDVQEELPRLLSGRYRLDEKIGQGGMGVVYRGVDLVMRRPVAVKLVRTREGVRIDEAVAGRFLREAKHTARIQHENIVDVFDLGRGEGGDLFFVMEHLTGQTLSQLLQVRERLEVADAVHIGAQIADALDAAHRGGIVHRDLKPANVMLVARGHDPMFVKVLDFGVAKSHAATETETALTRTGVLVGTIEYMAPEQILARKIDGRTDIYSLGVLLYRSITGTNPFRDALMPAMINKHLTLTPPSMQSRVPESPLALDRVIARCIQKEPEQRYASMAEVSRALREALLPESSALPELSATSESDADPYGVADEARTRVQRPRSAPPLSLSLTPLSPPSVPPPESTQVTLLTASAPVPSARMPMVVGASGEVVLPVLGASDESEEAAPAQAPFPPRLVCAMCNTPNVRDAIHCAACGVGLHTMEQQAVRARVTAGVSSRGETVRMDVATLLGRPSPPQTPSSGSPSAGEIARFPQAAPPWSAPPPPPSAPPPPPSAWARLLRWAGLRG